MNPQRLIKHILDIFIIKNAREMDRFFGDKVIGNFRVKLKLKPGKTWSEEEKEI